MKNRLILSIVLILLIQACSNLEPNPRYDTNSAKFVSLTLIDLYKNKISKIDGPRSGSYPTGSEFGHRAFSRYGVFWGFIITASRLLHEIDSNYWWGYRYKYGYLRKYDTLDHNTYWWDIAVQKKYSLSG